MSRVPKSLFCAALLLLSGVAVAEDEAPEPPPPWEAAEPKPAQPNQQTTLVLDAPMVSERFDRYQRVALVGTPFYVAGLSMAGWASYQIFVLDARGNTGVEVINFTGQLIGSAGAGALAFGSHSATMALFDDKPAAKHIIAGRIGYGMLAVGSITVIASIFTGDAAPLISTGGFYLMMGSGIPGMIQLAQNGKLKDLERGPKVSLVPIRGGMGLGVAGLF